MRKLFFIAVVMLITYPICQAQQNNPIPDRLKVFIDCSNTGCDMDFIRTEINLVDFMLDRIASDVHVLITEQSTGSGGSQFQLIFFGQNNFRQMKDTIRFNTANTATDFEERELLIKYLKLGLGPYVAKTRKAEEVNIDMKSKKTEGEKKDSSSKPTRDPWNYWVFRVGVDGYLQADANYNSSRLSGNMSANRITENSKFGLDIYGGENRTTYTLDNNGVMEKVKNDNNDYNFNNYLILAIGKKWSYGYQAGYSHSSFSNNKGRYSFESGVEYAIFPYKDVNTKVFTISYVLDVRRNNYFDTTLYEKLKETLFGQAAKLKLKFNQKWGTISIGLNYHNYFHDWKLYNLGFNSDFNVRISGGLSFNIYTYAELTHDQIFLPKEGATPQEVLIRRRQLASGYNIFTFFGINYRFGSKLNNFVNPRFE